jgi:hypothetical protein
LSSQRPSFVSPANRVVYLKINLLDQLAIDLVGVRISILLLIKGVIVFAVLLKLALKFPILKEMFM